ncbi:MAG: hypothetical protein NT169_28605 [Chloroflexi bacterium]|nr:hypothetical protein [Chloroflexota bacterium]
MTRRNLRFLGCSLSLLAGLPLALPAGAVSEVAAQAPVPLLDQFLALLANPNVAYFLFVLGLLGLVAEVVTAGAVFPGVLGAISLILALVGLGSLPTNWGGAALILAGVIMLVLDFKVTGYGLTVGGLIAFAIGSLLIFTPFWTPLAPEALSVRLSPWVIVGTTAGVAAFFVMGLSAAIRAQFRPLAVGRQLVVGRIGTVRQALAPAGIVHLDGEEWSATSADGATLPVGASVQVLAVDGLTLKVEATDKSG